MRISDWSSDVCSSDLMPIAVLEKGTLDGARALRTLLADLGALVAREAVQSPAIIVVGEVVDLSDAEDKLARWARIAETVACSSTPATITSTAARKSAG